MSTGKHKGLVEISKEITVSGVGFEPTPAYVDQNALLCSSTKQGFPLESGALDRSAILTALCGY